MKVGAVTDNIDFVYCLYGSVWLHHWSTAFLGIIISQKRMGVNWFRGAQHHPSRPREEAAASVGESGGGAKKACNDPMITLLRYGSAASLLCKRRSHRYAVTVNIRSSWYESKQRKKTKSRPHKRSAFCWLPLLGLNQRPHD